MKFILKFFPEIMVKGTPVKKHFVAMLTDNLGRLLQRIDPQIRYRRFHDKIEVYAPDSAHLAVRDLLQRTPGIQHFWEVEAFEVAHDLAQIAYQAEVFYRQAIVGKTFVVRVKRTGSHAFNSMEVARYVGEHLFELGESAGVDLKAPQVVVKLDVFDQTLNVVTGQFEGLGGYPLGSLGEVLSLMSGGFDSTVASYLAMKRGLKTHYVFFNLGGAAHEMGVKQVALYLWNRYGSSHRVKFISVPFEAVVAEIFHASHESYMGVMLKRMMLKAAEQMADALGIDTLLTGESVAQVSSQTLRNLAVIDSMTSKLVLRPLAMMDKPDIMALADRIGTRVFAESMPEYCGVISRNPVTSGSFERAEREERDFDWSILQQAIAQAQILNVDQIVDDINRRQAVEVCHHVGECELIDIRRDAERRARPLSLPHQAIPFTELNRAFKQLDSHKSYLLYCDKGVMSQLHAQYLRDAGFDNVRVYRPQ